MGQWGSGIKSIQRGTFTLNNPDLTDTQAINAVVMAKSIVIHNNSSTGTNPDDCMIRCVLTNTTTLTFTRGANAGGTISVWQVIEYY